MVIEYLLDLLSLVTSSLVVQRPMMIDKHGCSSFEVCLVMQLGNDVGGSHNLREHRLVVPLSSAAECGELTKVEGARGQGCFSHQTATAQLPCVLRVKFIMGGKHGCGAVGDCIVYIFNTSLSVVSEPVSDLLLLYARPQIHHLFNELSCVQLSRRCIQKRILLLRLLIG